MSNDFSSREFKLIQKNLKQRQDECNKRDSKLYINMFARMTRDTTVVTKVSGVSLVLVVSFNGYMIGNFVQCLAGMLEYISYFGKKETKRR